MLHSIVLLKGRIYQFYLYFVCKAPAETPGFAAHRQTDIFNIFLVHSIALLKGRIYQLYLYFVCKAPAETPGFAAHCETDIFNIFLVHSSTLQKGLIYQFYLYFVCKAPAETWVCSILTDLQSPFINLSPPCLQNSSISTFLSTFICVLDSTFQKFQQDFRNFSNNLKLRAFCRL